MRERRHRISSMRAVLLSKIPKIGGPRNRVWFQHSYGNLMRNSGCSTCTTSRMRSTTELATAAIPGTQSSGNTRLSKMVVIDLPVPAIPSIDTFRMLESVLKKDLTLPLIERHFQVHKACTQADRTAMR